MSLNRRSYGPRFQGGSGGGGSGGGGRARHHNPYPSFGGGGRPSKGGAKICVSNLDSEVTDGDVREIFQQVGRVASAVVNYDASGRSRGTAEVSFTDPRLAAKAVQEYDRAEVDGRPMFLTLVGGGGSRSKVLVSRMQPRFQEEDHSRGFQDRGFQDFQDYQDKPRKSRDRNFGGGGGRGRRKNSNNRGNDDNGQRSGGRGRGGGGGGRGGGRGRRDNKNSRPKEPTKTAEQLDQELEDYHKKSGGSTSTSSSKSGGSNKPLSSFTGQPTRPGN